MLIVVVVLLSGESRTIYARFRVGIGVTLLSAVAQS